MADNNNDLQSTTPAAWQDYIDNPPDPKALLQAKTIKSIWGKEAYRLLYKLDGGEVVKRRRTLLIVADYKMRGLSISKALKRKDCLSPTMFYKWLKKDPHTAAAYEHLTHVADTLYQQMLTVAEQDAVMALAQAQHQLKMEAPNNIQKLVDLRELSQDQNIQLSAANSLADRVLETSKSHQTRIGGTAGDAVEVSVSGDTDWLDGLPTDQLEKIMTILEDNFPDER